MERFLVKGQQALTSPAVCRAFSSRDSIASLMENYPHGLLEQVALKSLFELFIFFGNWPPLTEVFRFVNASEGVVTRGARVRQTRLGNSQSHGQLCSCLATTKYH